MEKLNNFEALSLDLFQETKEANFKYAKGMRLDFNRDGIVDSFNIGIFPAVSGENIFEAWSEPNGVEQEKEKGIVGITSFAKAVLRDVDVLTPIGLAAIIQAFGELHPEGFNVGVNNNAYYLHGNYLGIVIWLSSKSPARATWSRHTTEELKFH